MGWGTVPALHFHRWDQLPPSFHLLPSPPGRQACLTADSVTVLGQGEVDDCPAAPPPPGGVPSSTGERVLGSERGQEAAPPTPCRAPGSGGAVSGPRFGGACLDPGLNCDSSGLGGERSLFPTPAPKRSTSQSSLLLPAPRQAKSCRRTVCSFPSARPRSPSCSSCPGGGRKSARGQGWRGSGRPDPQRGFKFPPASGCATARGARAAGASENKPSP